MTTLLLVHAHPDDECIATGGVMLRARHDGTRVVLLTATRGEEGDIHNMDAVTVRPRLGEVRTAELMRSCEILGVDRQEFLGYRDSGMAGAPSNDDPRAFHAAPLHEAAERVATVLREERPDVVVTYTPDGTYWHPDHVKAHRTTLAALDLVAAEGWSPAKLYLHAVPRSAVEQIERRARESDVELPIEVGQIVGIPDEEITTIVDVSAFLEQKRAAFSAHLSQYEPDSPFSTIAAQIFEATLGTERFILARGALVAPAPERSLFAGL
jgi:N-acetyl-1-D-myo-inositol-2-amino-2-deoxy-alpha-D-glucopyranoside deacetylase